MLKIDKDCRLTGKDLNFILECKYEIKEQFNVSADKIGTSRWQADGYFTTFRAVKNYLIKENKISEENMVDFNAIIEKFDEAVKKFENITLPKEDNVKIIVNDKWYVVGSRLFFRVVKKEQIQKHRFTKEENIGKDKFINVGFTPNISIALKTILNEEILELVSIEKEISYSDIESIINNIVLNAESLTVEDARPEDQLEIDESICKNNDCIDMEE